MTHQNMRKNEKKMAILNSAFSLFRQNSVSATAIDDIVQACGIARGTFYLYFKDKSDLLEQLVMIKSSECMRNILEPFLNDDEAFVSADFSQIANTLINSYIDFLIENKDVLTILTKNISICLKKGYDFPDGSSYDCYQKIVAVMEKNGFSHEKAIKLLYIVADMIGSVCSDSILTSEPYPIGEMRDEILESALSILSIKSERGLTA